MFNTIKEDMQGELVEKKSRFIANLFNVESVNDAEEKIKEIKKKYFDARHNCIAYSIYTPDGIVNRFSDDGEPSGTAGAPMLNILNQKNIVNVVVVVTRYFGGILLGTGGLVRAYTGALQETLDKCEFVKNDIGLEVEIQIDYSEFEKMKYYLGKNNIEINNVEYLESVKVNLNFEKEKYNNFINSLNELNFKIINQKIIREKYIIIE